MSPHTLPDLQIYSLKVPIENEIKQIMDEINSPILTITSTSYHMGAMIIAKIGDFNRFDSLDKILAYVGMSPYTYPSGQLDNCYAHMKKHDSRYLRYAQICLLLG